MKLYIDHYSEIHKSNTIAFAVREGVLRDNHPLITDDLKFLTRKDINIIFYHNIPQNAGNNRFLDQNIKSKLPSGVEIKRVPSDVNLYEHILSIKQDVDKLIILERQFLVGEDGKKVNTISTKKLEAELAEDDIGLLGIGNVNFRDSLLGICKAVENGSIHRVHILPGGRKHAIKHELFSLEGDDNIIKGILDSNKGNKYLKSRTREYIAENIGHFKIACIDGIPVGCVEIIKEDSRTIELGALAVLHSFLSLRIGMGLIEHVEKYAISNGMGIISMTNNDKLQGMYERIGFKKDDEGLYEERSKKSPGVQLFYIDHNTLIENYVN